MTLQAGTLHLSSPPKASAEPSAAGNSRTGNSQKIGSAMTIPASQVRKNLSHQSTGALMVSFS